MGFIISEVTEGDLLSFSLQRSKGRGIFSSGIEIGLQRNTHLASHMPDPPHRYHETQYKSQLTLDLSTYMWERRRSTSDKCALSVAGTSTEIWVHQMWFKRGGNPGAKHYEALVSEENKDGAI